jgi:hypothetical protein
MWLQTQINCLLERFNSEIKEEEKGVPLAKIDKLEKPKDGLFSGKEEQGFFMKMRQDEEKRKRGY